jgi:uncharacterized protein with GYD domain
LRDESGSGKVGDAGPEGHMATFIGLMKFTDQGVKSIKEVPKRVEENRKRMKEMGIEIKSWHLTLGRYDVVVVFEAASDEAAAKAAIAIAGQGNIHGETLRAFSVEEVAKIVA